MSMQQALPPALYQAAVPTATSPAPAIKATPIALRRNLLLAVSVSGEEVAQSWLDRIISASQHYFATANPPVRGLAVALTADDSHNNSHDDSHDDRHDASRLAANEGVAHKLVEAAMEMAELSYARELSAAGICFQDVKQMELWLIMDLTGEGGAAAGGNEPSPAQVTKVKGWLEKSIRQLYRELRLHLNPHLLLICEPSAQAIACQWQSALASHCPAPTYLAGPINQNYLSNPDWRQHTATALTILLWSDLDATGPSDGGIDGRRSGSSDLRDELPLQPGQWVRALGGAAWLSPRRLLCRWLTLQWALDWCAHLLHPRLQSASNPPAHNAALGIKPFRTAWQELLAIVPPSIQYYRWMTRYPGLTLLHQLPQRLQAQVEADAHRRLASQNESRRQWTKSQLAHWQAALTQQVEQWLRPEQGLPELARARLATQALLDHLAATHQEAVELLAIALRQWRQKSAAVEQSLQALQGVCNQFPPATASGLLQALLKPWRWAALAHLYASDLEMLTGKALAQLAAQGEAAWQRANLLTLCDLYAAMSQMATTALQEIEQPWRSVNDLHSHLLAQMVAIDEDELYPWTTPKLQQLYAQHFGDGYLLARQFYLELWRPVGGEWTTEQLMLALLTWAAPRVQPVAEWSAVETLSAALPSVEEVRAWSQAWQEGAAPLWPHEELLAEDESATWVFGLPVTTAEEQAAESMANWLEQLANQVVRPPVEGRAQYQLDCERRLRAELTAERMPNWSATAVDGLLCLRWMPVNLAARYQGQVGEGERNGK